MILFVSLLFKLEECRTGKFMNAYHVAINSTSPRIVDYGIGHLSTTMNLFST
jgi:hypothetical protein